ncbi:MAG TPA: hypothetical protein VGL89_06420 [Candidatus Koribacter sp.]|jgi:hypothetical protein
MNFSHVSWKLSLRFRFAIILLSLASMASLPTIVAQAPPQTKKSAKAKAASKPAQSPAWQAVDEARKGNIDALTAYVKAHPADFDDAMIAYNTGFALETFIKDNAKDSAKLSGKLTPLADAFASVGPNGRTNFYWAIASSLRKNDALLPFAETIARKSVDEVTQADYMAAQLKEHQAYMKYLADAAAKAGKPKPEESPFDEQESLDRYRGDMSRRLTILGKIEIKLDEKKAAESDLTRAVEMNSNSDALLNLAHLAADRGDKPESLRIFTRAYLRGQLKANEIDEFKKLYFELHPGDEASLHQYLNAEYDKSFHNPADATPYHPDPQRSDRAVLLEIFTGAGCESCVSVDLSADAMLERYSRNELVTLFYQTSAPTDDPLSNKTVGLREDFYQTHRSAPHTFIDGQEIQAEGESEKTKEIDAKLMGIVDKNLDAAPAAQLHVDATRNGNQVHVKVTGTSEKLPKTARLQIMLVEKEVDYSGENGLRYHPMVVRAGANRTDDNTGYPVTASTISQDSDFDLDQVTADNLKWYDDYLTALRKRLPPSFEIDGFKEKKNVMNWDKLAIVAFLQDDKTKQVLQSIYVPVQSGNTTAEVDANHAH